MPPHALATQVAGEAVARNVARWNGTRWSAVGEGLVYILDPIRAFAVFDDGSGPALYAASYAKVIRWHAGGWTTIGSFSSFDFMPDLWSFGVFDGGSGPALYVGAEFEISGGGQANLAKWDGMKWTPLQSGPNKSVEALAVFDDGGGAALHLAGGFTQAGGVSASNIAKWDGSSWSALGSGTDRPVRALAVYDAGAGPAFFAVGDFLTAGGKASAFIGRWGCEGIYGDLNCDGVVDQFDVDPFVLALVDPKAYCASYTQCHIENAGCNEDGAVNAFDIDPFINLLAQP